MNVPWFTYSKTATEHQRYLRFILETLRKNKLYASFAKCEFFKKEIEYLGHVSGDGLKIYKKGLKSIP